jgi:nucleoside-diphosphate-sugar epimerase
MKIEQRIPLPGMGSLPQASLCPDPGTEYASRVREWFSFPFPCGESGVGVRVLVTGHDGYVGTLLMGLLEEAGHEAVGVDAGYFAGCGLPEARQKQVPPARRVDLRDLSPSAPAGFHAVIHLAALSNDPLGNLNPQLTHDINRHASLRLASAAKAAGVSRFLFASSCSLYGAAGSSHVGEDAPLRPLTPYGVSKVEVEKGLLRLADDTFTPTFLRAATAYGVSPRLRGDVVVNNLVGSALTRGEVRLLSDGRSWRPLLHVDDMCRAFLAVLDAPRQVVHGEAFNLAPEGENYQIRDVAEMVAECVPGVRVTFAEGGGEPDPRSYRVDGSKLRSAVPAFSPRWTVPDGIRQVYSALSRVDLTEEEFFGPPFLRLPALRRLMEEGRLDWNLRWADLPPSGAGAGSRAFLLTGPSAMT